MSHSQQFFKSRKNGWHQFREYLAGKTYWHSLRENLSSQISTDGSFDFSFRYAGELEYKEKEIKSMEFSNGNKG